MPFTVILLYRALTLTVQASATWALLRFFGAEVRWLQVFVITGVAMAVHWFGLAAAEKVRRLYTHEPV